MQVALLYVQTWSQNTCKSVNTESGNGKAHLRVGVGIERKLWIWRVSWIKIALQLKWQLYKTATCNQGCRQPAELTSYLACLCWLLLWYIYIFKDKLFVPLLAQIYESETYFSLQFIDLKIIWLVQRYTIISSLHWVLGTTCKKFRARD